MMKHLTSYAECAPADRDHRFRLIAERYAPLDRFNTSNVKHPKRAYSVGLGGTSTTQTANRQRSPKSASSTSSITGVCCTRSTAGPVISANRVAHGPGPGKAAARQSRRSIMGPFRHRRRELPTPRDRYRQRDRQGRVGCQPL